MVTGSRFIAADNDGYRSSASRRIGIRIFARVLSTVVRRRITDPTSGLRMIDRRGIELFARDYPHDYPEVEAIVLSHAHRLAGAEVPVRMRARRHRLLLDQLDAVGLLHDQGAAGGARRPAARAPGDRVRRRGRRPRGARDL